MTPGRLIIVGYVIVLVAIGVNTVQGVLNASSISSNARVTCEVQARALMAQPYLTAAMSDIAKLLTPQPGAKIPPGEKAAFVIVGDLRAQLGAYVALESQQPRHRNCGT